MEDKKAKRGTAEQRNEDTSAASGPGEGPDWWPGVGGSVPFEPLAPGQEEWARRTIAEIRTAMDDIRVKMRSATTAEAIELTRLTERNFCELHVIWDRLRRAGIAMAHPAPTIILAGAAVAPEVLSGGATGPTPRPRDPADADRNKFIYEQRLLGKGWKKIKTEVDRHLEWDSLSERGLANAANIHATDNRIPTLCELKMKRRKTQ